MRLQAGERPLRVPALFGESVLQRDDQRLVPRVLFVVTGLMTGGAEMMLWKLLSTFSGAIEPAVVSLLGPGRLSREITALGVPVQHLDLRRPWMFPATAWHIGKFLRRFNPHVIQGWMYHGNLAALAARSFCAGSPRLVWGIRQSLYDLRNEKRGTRWVIRLTARLSGRVDAIVYNSETARAQHEALGFSPPHSLVIDNGFDTELFRPDPTAYREVRKELGLAADTPLIGLIARSHPMKGHEVFLGAAAMLVERMPAVHFLLAGKNVTATNPVFASWAAMPVLAGRLHLLGERRDVARLTAALDIASSSSSWGEAFPNALGEAMSCAVPCVATNVGDVPRIVGDTGIVVPAGDAQALALAWERLLSGPPQARIALGEAARRRVQENFALQRVAAQYQRLYSSEPQ
jgi:glycosyltransferase involved in cell wall biosynthesis